MERVRGEEHAQLDVSEARDRLVIAESDIVLAEQIRGGDEAAFSRMYLAYYPLLGEYAASLTKEQSSANDIVQEIFFNIWHDRANWRPGHIAAYLYRATRNRALNYLGTARRQNRLNVEHLRTSVLEETSPGSGEGPIAPDDAVHLTRFRIAIEQAFDRLPGARREVALLRWRQGRSLAEIAAVTGSSVKAVSMQLARIRASLQHIIDAHLTDE